MSLLSRTAEGTGWKVYAAGILAVNLAVFLLNWIVSDLFPADVRMVDVVYLAVHGLVLAWAVYRPIVRRWGFPGYLAQFLLAPLSLILTIEVYLWFSGDGFPGFVTFFVTPILWLALLPAGRADFSRPLARGRARSTVGSPR